MLRRYLVAIVCLCVLGGSSCGGGSAASDSKTVNANAGTSYGGGATSSSGPGGAATDGGGTATVSGGTNSSATSTPDGVACGSLLNDAELLGPTTLSEAAPAPEGGTLTSGTYALTELIYYTNGDDCVPPNIRTRAVIRVIAGTTTAGSVEEVVDQTAASLSIINSRDVFEYSSAAQTLALTFACVGAVTAFGRNAANPVSYSASADAIRVFGDHAPCGTSVSVFSRR